MTTDADRQRWNGRYAADEYVFGTEPSDFLVEQAGRFAPGQKVLLVADGEGRNGVFLARQGVAATSFDLAVEGIGKARRLAARHGVTLDIREGDVRTWNWSETSYDAVVGVFIQFADPATRTQLFAGMVTALKPGGLLFLRGYTPKQLEYRTGGPSERDNLYTPDLLRKSFPDLDVLELTEREKILDEGAGHSGMSAIVDFVGRKV